MITDCRIILNSFYYSLEGLKSSQYRLTTAAVKIPKVLRNTTMILLYTEISFHFFSFFQHLFYISNSCLLFLIIFSEIIYNYIQFRVIYNLVSGYFSCVFVKLLSILERNIFAKGHNTINLYLRNAFTAFQSYLLIYIYVSYQILFLRQIQ